MSIADWWIVAVLSVVAMAVVAYLIYRWVRNRNNAGAAAVGGAAPAVAGGGAGAPAGAGQPAQQVPVQTTGVYYTPYAQ